MKQKNWPHLNPRHNPSFRWITEFRFVLASKSQAVLVWIEIAFLFESKLIISSSSSLLFHCSFSIYLWKLNRFFFSCVFIYSDFNQFEIVRFVNYHNSFFSNNKTVKKIKSNFRFFLQLFTKNNKCLFTFLLIIMTKLM